MHHLPLVNLTAAPISYFPLHFALITNVINPTLPSYAPHSRENTHIWVFFAASNIPSGTPHRRLNTSSNHDVFEWAPRRIRIKPPHVSRRAIRPIKIALNPFRNSVYPILVILTFISNPKVSFKRLDIARPPRRRLFVFAPRCQNIFGRRSSVQRIVRHALRSYFLLFLRFFIPVSTITLPSLRITPQMIYPNDVKKYAEQLYNSTYPLIRPISGSTIFTR